MADDVAVLSRTHNLPPADQVIIDALDPDALRERLERDYADTAKRGIELEIGANQCPKEVKTEAEAKKIVDWVAQQVRAWDDKAKKEHDKEKKPYWDCGKVIDAFFNLRRTALAEKLKAPQAAVAAFRRRKEAEVRQAEEVKRQAAREAQQVAESVAASAAAAVQLSILSGDRAAAVEQQAAADLHAARAAAATRIVTAAPAKVHIDGEYGATAFAVEKWTYEIEDLSLIPHPGRYWKLDEVLIQKDIDSGVREIPGLRIYRDDQFRIRKC